MGFPNADHFAKDDLAIATITKEEIFTSGLPYGILVKVPGSFTSKLYTQTRNSIRKSTRNAVQTWDPSENI